MISRRVRLTKYRQFAAVKECPGSNAGHALGNGNLPEVGAVGKGPGTDACHRIGNIYPFQVINAIKGIISDGDKRRGIRMVQPIAVVESLGPI